MPWFGIPEFLKKRACRYLLQHYLGQFLEEKISLEDLTVDLYNGTGSIFNIPLNVQSINESLKGVGAPVQVLSGYIERVTVSVPWAALLKDNCKVELSGLNLTIAPHASFKMEEYMSMTDSLFFSMTSSRQMAEEVLKEGQRAGEAGADNNTGFEGMETLARAIEMVLARVQVTLKDTVIQINYSGGSHQNHGCIKHFLRFRVSRTEFYDELSQVESSADSPEGETPPPPTDFAVKLLHLLDVSIELGSASVDSNEYSSSIPDVESVPIAVAGGKLSVTVTIKQSDQVPGPKLRVEGFLGSLHVLLSPQQLGSLLQLAKEVAEQTNQQTFRREKLSPGQSRPIPRVDRSALESQLARHQHHEKEVRSRQHRKQHDLLTSDPWDDPVPPQRNPGSGANPFNATTDSNEQFFSLDLNSSFSSSMANSISESLLSGSNRLSEHHPDQPQDLKLQIAAAEERKVKQDRRGIIHRHSVESDVDIPLHDGLGLQQLSGPSKVNSDPFDLPQSNFPPQKSPPSKLHSPTLGKREKASSRASHEPLKHSSLSSYSLTLNGATIALLEANPSHIYTTKVNKQPSLSSLDRPSESPPTSIDEGGLDPVRYFELVAEWLSEGVHWHSYQQYQKQLAQFLPADHLLVWLSVLRGNVGMEEEEGSYEVTLAGAEVWEHLYHNHTPHINLITRPVSMCPIIQLQGDLQHTPPKPCLRVKVHSTPDHSHKRKVHSTQCTVMDVGVALSAVNLNVDPTLLDRLQLLLATPPEATGPSMQRSSMDKVKRSLYMTSSNMHSIQQQRQLVFNQALQPGYSTSPSSTLLKLTITGDKLHLSLRFPVPQSKKTQQPPWFRPSLRTEVLFVDLSDWQVFSQLHPLAMTGEASYAVEAQCTTANVFLSTSGSQVDKELFLVVSSRSSGARPSSVSNSSSMEMVSIRVEVQPEPDRTLEQRQEEEAQEVPYMLDLLAQSCYEKRAKKQPLPFSNKRSMFSARHPAAMDAIGDSGGEDKGADIHSEEHVLPGSLAEMNEFESHAFNTARYLISGHLPEVRIHLPSKQFFEALYNRFCVDLALWEPASAAAVNKANAKSVMYSCMDLLQPAVTSEERFLMCKSALKEEASDDDDDDYDDGDLKARLDALQDERTRELSSLALSITIDDGVVTLIPDIQEQSSENSEMFQSALDKDLIDISCENKEEPCGSERRCGMAVMDISGFHGFYVMGYKGNVDHHYACGWVQDSSLYHHGNPDCSPDKCCSVSPTFDLSVYRHLMPILSSHSQEDQPMFALAMEVQAEKEHSTLTRKVALSLSNTALFYHVTPSNLGLQQLGLFFDIKEESVEGIETPALVTELHSHVINCTLEYRPLYLPLVATVMLDLISMSTSIVAGAPVHVLRVVLDGAYLLLTATKAPPTTTSSSFPYSSSSSGSPSSSVCSSSVCVMELEWLELTLRHCNSALLNKEVQKLLSDMPDLSVECSSNVVHFRMCVDSCIALRDLLSYLSARQDLKPRPKNKDGATTDSMWDYFSVPLPAVAGSVSSVAAPADMDNSNLPSNSTPPLSRNISNDHTASDDIGDLISDAMEEASPTLSRSMIGSEDTKGSKNFVAPGKMDVRMTGNSLIMDFDSDTDEEEGLAKPRQFPAKSADLNGPMVPPSDHLSSRAVSGSGNSGDLFRDADDDFCIVDTPTFTRVSPGSKPVVKCLLEDDEHIEVVQDYFSIPDGRVNLLQRPSSFPLPEVQYTLKEMTVIWHLYGGRDFVLPSSAGKKPGHGSRNRGGTVDKKAGLPSTAAWRQSRARLGNRYGLDLRGSLWKVGGGPDRDHSVLVEVELDKLRVQHETYPPSLEQVCRIVVLVGEVEVRDKLAQSEINKLLYQYTTEAMPRQSHASMVSVKILYTRPELDVHEEASVHVSILPLRLNLDQDTVLFLYNFIQQAGDSKHLSMFESENASKPVAAASAHGEVTSIPEPSRAGSCDSHPMKQAATEDSFQPEAQPEAATVPQNQQVFVRSFKFHPDLPIRIDYEAKGFKTEIGTVAGILLGLSHLNTAEVNLKALHYKKGLLGWDKVLEYSTDEWLRDITSYQLPLLFKGVGPLNSFSQLVSGVFKFVQLPCQQYQEDGRVIFGLQRGATALTSSTGVAVVELTSQLLEAVQALAQMAYDLVAPGERVPRPLASRHHRSHQQPVDFREGFSNAYTVVSTGIGDTATNLITMASKEHQERGTASAVGTVLRHVPGALVQPIILASEATRHVLGGVRNQFVPDARNEAHKKWKSLESPDESKKS